MAGRSNSPQFFLDMQLKLRTWLLLIGALLALLSNWIVVSEPYQFKLLLFSMILFGVPHGALDLYIEGKTMQSGDIKGNTVLLKYLLNILAYALLWYFFPLISLILFIIITAYHFGEIDWIGKSDHLIHKVFYFFLGMCWILYFLSVNVQSALKIFLYVGESSVSQEQWVAVAKFLSPITLGIIIIFYLTLFIYRKYFYFRSSHYYYSVLQLVVLLLICHYSTLWIGFGFYFGLWHSILSFDKIRLNFNMPNSSVSWMKLLKQAMPFSIMAWIGMLFIMFMFYSSKNATSLVTLLFITLSVLTLPHLQVFTKLKLKSPDLAK
jgi:Brp/Blh family beta-carotene 15,15'-monooxygenase